MLTRIIIILALAFTCVLSAQQTPLPGADWVPLFNGKDLKGWVNVNCAPDTFTVRDGVIVCTGKPIGVMRTERHYENFVLELEPDGGPLWLRITGSIEAKQILAAELTAV